MSGGNSRRVAANTAWLFSEKIIGRVITFFLVVILARALGTVGFGKLNFATSFASLFIILADMGIATLITRDLAGNRDDAPEYFGKSVVLVLPLIVLAAVVITGAAVAADVPGDTFLLIFLLAGYLLLKNLATIYAAVFRAFERMHYASAVMVAERVLLLGFCLVALQSSNKLIGVGVSHLLAGLFFFLLTAALVHARFFVPRYRLRTEHLRYVVREGFPLAVVAVISLFYYNIDMIMLGKLRGEEAVGIYGAAYRLFFTVSTLFTPLLTAVFPAMARLFHEHDAARLRRAYRTSFKILLGAGVPLSIGGFILSRGIVDFVYGSEFAASAPVFRWFSLIIFVGYVNGVNAYFLTSLRRQGLIAKAIATTAAINLVLNGVLIPEYGELGAVWATMVSEFLFLGIVLASIPREFRGFSTIAAGKCLSVAAGMGVAVYYLQAQGVRLLVTIAAGAVVYALGLLLVRYLDGEEIDTLRRAVRREG